MVSCRASLSPFLIAYIYLHRDVAVIGHVKLHRRGEEAALVKILHDLAEGAVVQA